MDRTNRFMSSEALKTFRRGITPDKNKSFDALSNQLVSACAEICQKHKVNLNYGDFSASFLSIVKEYMRGDLYEDKGAIIKQLRTSGTMIQKVIIEQLDKHINLFDKLTIVQKHDGTYSNILGLKTTAFKQILSFIDSSAFKNKVQEVSQQSNLFKQEATKEIIKPEIKREPTRSEVEGEENARYSSNPLQLVPKHEIPKEIKPEIKRELTRSQVEGGENDRYSSNRFQLVQTQEDPIEPKELLKNKIKEEILSKNVTSIVKRIEERIPQKIRHEIDNLVQFRAVTYTTYLDIRDVFQNNKYFSEIEKMLLMYFLTTEAGLFFLEDITIGEIIFINNIIENDECSNPFGLLELPKDL